MYGPLGAYVPEGYAPVPAGAWRPAGDGATAGGSAAAPVGQFLGSAAVDSLPTAGSAPAGGAQQSAAFSSATGGPAAPLVAGATAGTASYSPTSLPPVAAYRRNYGQQQQPTTTSAYGGGVRRPGGGCFLCAVLLLIIFLYVGYVFVLLAPLLVPSPLLLGVVLFLAVHICFSLLLLSFFKAVFTDPGRVPANWGFYMGDENKRRRYCKVCNVWKPDRTHHCSACGRCVLNMDHHCPWINNCVGFYNRKYFIQVLVYALLSLLIIFVHGFYFIFMESIHSTSESTIGRASPTHAERIFEEESHSPTSVLKYVYVCLMLFLSMVLIFALVPFSRFHLNLVLRNSTTIENMDVNNRDRNRYDLGVSRNIEQVFGTNPCCWLVPLHSSANRPVGDGVRWSMHYMVANDEQV